MKRKYPNTTKLSENNILLRGKVSIGSGKNGRNGNERSGTSRENTNPAEGVGGKKNAPQQRVWGILSEKLEEPPSRWKGGLMSVTNQIDKCK